MKNVTLFVLCCALTTLFGLLLYAQSTGYELKEGGAMSSFRAFSLQALWVGCGALAFWLVARVDYRSLPAFAAPLLAVSWLLMLAVYVPHMMSGNYRSSSCLPFFTPSFCPARWALPASILYLATAARRRPSAFTRAAACPSDRALTGILCATLLLVAASGGLRPPILLFLTLLTMALAVQRRRVAAGLALFSILLLLIYLVSAPHRLDMLLSHYSGPPQYCDTPITVRMFRHAGWAGIGLGNSYYRHVILPREMPDFLTSIAGEELGWLCALAALGCVAGILLSGLVIARRAPDRFGRDLAGGLVACLFFQTLMHVAAVLNWTSVCMTIIPMPFISELGCNTVIPLVCAGLLLSISRQKEREVANTAPAAHSLARGP